MAGAFIILAALETWRLTIGEPDPVYLTSKFCIFQDIFLEAGKLIIFMDNYFTTLRYIFLIRFRQFRKIEEGEVAHPFPIDAVVTPPANFCHSESYGRLPSVEEEDRKISENV